MTAPSSPLAGEAAAETNASTEKSVVRGEVVRYAINGAVATLVHFTVFAAAKYALGDGFAGLSNAIGAVFGITTSFIGSRYFVFPHRRGDWRGELGRFLALYGALAVMHFLVLYFWTDIGGLNPFAGFVVATILQVVATFFGNRLLVFRNGQ